MERFSTLPHPHTEHPGSAWVFALIGGTIVHTFLPVTQHPSKVQVREIRVLSGQTPWALGLL